MFAFWGLLIIGVIVLIGCLAAIDYGEDVAEVFYGVLIACGLIYLAGFFYPKASDTFFTVSSITQTNKGYIITTNSLLRIFQKQCTYKIGDTLWIKK